MLDSPRQSFPLKDYVYNEMHYKILTKTDPEEAERLLDSAEKLVELRWETYEYMSKQESAKYQLEAGPRRTDLDVGLRRGGQSIDGCTSV